MIRATVVNKRTLLIVGIDPQIPRAVVRDWLGDVAEQVDQRIAADFESERAAGAALRANQQATTEHKAAEGLDLRRGHATGNLQDHLDKGGYWAIGAMNTRSVAIHWNEDRLQADVDYAEFVAQAIVRGGRILAVLQKDARMSERYLAERESDWQHAKAPERPAVARAPRLRDLRTRILGTGVRVA